MWEGAKIRLVPMCVEKHCDNYVEWMNGDGVGDWMIMSELPTTWHEMKVWLEKRGSIKNEARFAIETLDGRHVGSASLQQIDWFNRTAISGLFIGPTAERGKGYGLDAAMVRSKYAFEVLGLRMIYSEVLADNVAIISLLEKIGYKKCGCKPAFIWKRGEFKDVTILALSKEDWESTGCAG
jgi:RimJ/RimL family protein N-acetyltransferase